MEILKKLKHPNILQVLDLLEDEENYYIATEYLSGGTLKDRVDQGPIAEKDAAKIMK